MQRVKTVDVLHAEMKYTVPNVKNKHYENYVDQMPSCDAKTFAITGTTTGTHNRSPSYAVFRDPDVHLLPSKY